MFNLSHLFCGQTLVNPLVMQTIRGRLELNVGYIYKRMINFWLHAPHIEK